MRRGGSEAPRDRAGLHRRGGAPGGERGREALVKQLELDGQRRDLGAYQHDLAVVFVDHGLLADVGRVGVSEPDLRRGAGGGGKAPELLVEDILAVGVGGGEAKHDSLGGVTGLVGARGRRTRIQVTELDGILGPLDADAVNA